MARPLKRICGAGIFANPNDLSRILVIGMVVCLYRAGDPKARVTAPFWLGVLALLAYALTLTQSRGGFVALIVSVLVLFHARYGTWKTLGLGVLAVPALFWLFAGRQTNLDLEHGTGQQRIHVGISFNQTAATIANGSTLTLN